MMSDPLKEAANKEKILSALNLRAAAVAMQNAAAQILGGVGEIDPPVSSIRSAEETFRNLMYVLKYRESEIEKCKYGRLILNEVRSELQEKADGDEPQS